jgi:release factor glutamine methyltransferase
VRPDTITIAATLHTIRQQLMGHSDSPAVDARRLLGYVLERPSAWLLAHGDNCMPEDALQQLEALVTEYQTGRPLPYILGAWQFCQWEFIVTEDVLIPRPETEELVIHAADWLRTQANPAPTIVDVGTGSGAIAIALALMFPAATVYALDISPQALAVAQDNATRLGAKNVHLLESDLLTALPTTVSADIIVANLPYIDSATLSTLSVSRWEPRLALDGGADGLRDIRRLLDQLPGVARPQTQVLLEIGADQGNFFQTQHGDYAALRVYRDLSGRDRIVSLTW